MAATQKGVWDLQQVRDKQLQSEWDYTAPALMMSGQNDYGQLGQNSLTHRSSPIQIPGSKWSVLNSVQGGGTDYAMMAITTDGELFSWGGNNGTYGSLGLNDNAQRSSPTQVGTDATWSDVSSGGGSSQAIKTNGTLWAWGQNIEGQLGLNTVGPTNQYSSPTQVGTSTEWGTILAGRFSIATKTNRTLWTWGYNVNGELGLNDKTRYSSPVQVGTGTDWDTIGSGTYSLMGTKTDGTLWMWGYNARGNLGHNNRTEYSSPKQVPGTTWKEASGGYIGSGAVKTDGTLWSMGYNDKGQLGHNDRTDRSSPTQIPGTTWDTVSFTYKGASATKTDGTLWSWGYNLYGQAAQNSRAAISSPTQVGTSTGWSSTIGGQRDSLAVIGDF